MSIILPQITVQHDFLNVIADVQDGTVQEEPFWISCYKENSPSVHGKVKVQRKAGGGVDLTPEAIDLHKNEHGVYTVACPSLCIPPTRLRGPRQAIGEESRKPVQITAFDVAPDGSLYATGDGDGNLRVASTSDQGNSTLKSKPHLSTILSLRFFPSSKVILTSSNDFTLSIISAENLVVPRTLKGHSRAVTDTGIISRGRNVLSCAKDGTLRLWDVGSGSQIRVWGVKDYSPASKMAIGLKGGDHHLQPPDGESTESTAIPMDPREVETADKVAFVALHNGSFQAFDLGTKTSFYQSDPPTESKAPLESMVYSSEDHILATGSRKGVITVYDTRQISAPLFSFKRSDASIEDLAFVPAENDEVRLGVASADGLPYVVSVRPEGPQVVDELVGYNCDSVRNIKVSGRNIWTSGDDGIVRRY